MQTIAGYQDGTTSACGIEFHYLEWGEGASPPMVLLHGLTGHAHIWDHMAPQLAERFRVLALDQRGHGDSGHAASYATADFTADLEELVGQRWTSTPFVLIGLSMGGHNAMSYAAAHPEQVSRLIVIDIPPRLKRDPQATWDPTSRPGDIDHPVFERFEDAVETARAGTPTAPQANLEYRTWWNMRQLPGGGMTFKYDPLVPMRWEPVDLWGELPRIVAPTLLVRGELTQVLPLSVAERMVAAMPDAELVQVPGSGHSVPTDKPEALAPIVLEWLARRA
ncbi:MAG: alpha/beta hydrolase [Dehalococcoidia bacterium]|nr:MAG: alpha/beta hydrolase [Dehalococcoidia bacterium]